MFGFTGISMATADIARILLVIFVVLLILGLAAAPRVWRDCGYPRPMNERMWFGRMVAS